MDYAAAYGRLDTLSCLMAYGCEISDQTVTTLLSGDLAVGAPSFNRCIWKGITTARCVYTRVCFRMRVCARVGAHFTDHAYTVARVYARRLVVTIESLCISCDRYIEKGGYCNVRIFELSRVTYAAAFCSVHAGHVKTFETVVLYSW